MEGFPDLFWELLFSTFGSKVKEQFIAAKIEMADLPLKFEEIKVEFPELSLRKRRELEEFLVTYVLKEDNDNSDYSAVFDSSTSSSISCTDSADVSESFEDHSSDSTIPTEENLDQTINTSRTEHSFKTKLKKSRLFTKFKAEPQISRRLYKAKKLIYPTGIAHPFPLSTYFRKYLLHTSRTMFCKQYAAYKRLVKEIYAIVELKLGRGPTAKERKLVSIGLVREYPVLGCGYPAHFALSEALRKRGNTQNAAL